MMSSLFDNSSPSQLLERSKKIHEEMVSIYNEQVRSLQIKLAMLEDENLRLKKELRKYTDGY